jgi:hypothetical protein
MCGCGGVTGCDANLKVSLYRFFVGDFVFERNTPSHRHTQNKINISLNRSKPLQVTQLAM